MFNTVPRTAHDELQARFDKLEAKYDKLVQQMVSLKRKGYELPGEHKPGRVIQSPPSPEESATKRMHDRVIEEIIETTAQQVAKSRGISVEAARAEIIALRDQGLGGSVSEPPL